MQLTLEELERALSPIEDLGREELVFPVNGTFVTLRVLTPEEEGETQKFATAGIGDDESFVAATAFLERLKLAVLSYAVAKVGDQDFREGDGFTETGELLNGKKVRVPQHMALRKLIQRWPGAVRSAMFRKYSELMGKVEARAEAAIQFEPSDKEAEIERLEKRILELRTEPEPGKGGFSHMIKTTAAVVEHEADVREGRTQTRIQEEVPAVALVEVPDEMPAKASLPPPQQRASIIPSVAQPPAPQKEVPRPVQNDRPVSNASPIDFEEEGSLVDMSDPEAVEKAIGRENARLMAMRRGVPLPEPPSAIGYNTSGGRPPHLDAAEVAQQMVPVEGPTEAGTLGDVPVYRMPVQELNTPIQAPLQGNLKAPVNKSGEAQQSRNPRFKPPTQP